MRGRADLLKSLPFWFDIISTICLLFYFEIGYAEPNRPTYFGFLVLKVVTNVRGHTGPLPPCATLIISHVRSCS